MIDGKLLDSFPFHSHELDKTRDEINKMIAEHMRLADRLHRRALGGDIPVDEKCALLESESSILFQIATRFAPQLPGSINKAIADAKAFLVAGRDLIVACRNRDAEIHTQLAAIQNEAVAALEREIAANKAA